MTGRLRLLLVAAIAVAVYPAVTATPAAAGTEVTVPRGVKADGGEVTITVPIDSWGYGAWSPAAVTAYQTLPSLWPVVCPALPSPENRYSGWPL
jgi:hypothetical protein